MSDIQSLIKMLQSNNPNKRYEACEELRVSPWLPPEALEVLRLVTNDANPDVADAAQRALALHAEMKEIPLSLPPKPLKVKTSLSDIGQLLIGFIGWLFISTWFNLSVVLKLDMNYRDVIFYVVLIINQLVGLGLAFLAFRFNMHWIGIGILWGFGLFLLGSILRGCFPPLLLPFPLTALSGC